jgi:hypothetical protein
MYQPAYMANSGPRVKASEHNMGEVGGHTSVKVHAPPGGRSNLNVFAGSDDHEIAPAKHGRGMASGMYGDNSYNRQNSRQNLGSSYQIGAASS